MSSDQQDAGLPPQTFLHKVAAAPPPPEAPVYEPPGDHAPVTADEAPAGEAGLAHDEPGLVHDEPGLVHDETAPIADEPEPAAMEPVAVRASDLSQEAPDGPLLGAAADELMTRWRQAAASFVDDPKAAVAGATDVISEAISRWRAAIRDREQALNGRGDADTEELRQAMLGYRRLLDTLLS